MSNPKIVLNQKAVPSVTASNHNMHNKILSRRILIWFKLYHIYDKLKRAMIDIENILGRLSNTALWCGAGMESVDLAGAASVAIDKSLDTVSVSPESVPVIWPWLENKKIKILARFYVSGGGGDDVSALSENVNRAFKQGADGVQIFVPMNNLDDFVTNIFAIRDDLFFNKGLFIGFDINEIGPFDWQHLYAVLKKIRVDGVVLALPRDDGNKSDFVGRVYAALDAWNLDNRCEINFVVGNSIERIEQACRLVNIMQPQLQHSVRFFINF